MSTINTGRILAAIGTPAKSPKPRGKSPVWSPCEPRQRRIRASSGQKRYYTMKVVNVKNGLSL
ncbi:hypothetical protein [Brasilonema bromeliae]|uniref:hypothetical protein n=1 Tax=Brasilonema bromeliae TaxID=383615 RepID=UPI00145C9AC0|nr:hypothetical protein [Brasilonema bromeliae]